MPSSADAGTDLRDDAQTEPIPARNTRTLARRSSARLANASERLRLLSARIDPIRSA
jgi:hypothetical protein